MRVEFRNSSGHVVGRNVVIENVVAMGLQPGDELDVGYATYTVQRKRFTCTDRETTEMTLYVKEEDY